MAFAPGRRLKHCIARGRELRPAAEHRFGFNSADPTAAGAYLVLSRDRHRGRKHDNPYVRLNGAIAGVPDPGGAFYRDVPPGTYRITVDSEGNSPRPTQEVVLVAGQQIYARIGLGGSWNGQGFTITMEPGDVGHAAVEHSKFYGG